MGRRSKQTFLQRRHTDGWQENEDHKLLKEMQIQSRNDAEAEAPILWPPDVKSWFTRKDPDARKDWAQEKGLTEDETVELHHWLNGHEFEQTLGYSEGQGSLVCCSPWVHKELDMTEQVNNNLCLWCVSLSRVWLFATPQTIARQAPLSNGFSRKEYWSGLPCSPPESLPNPGIKPTTPISPGLVGGIFTTSTTWETVPGTM